MESLGISILTSILFAIVVGIMLLFVEYRTGWFASRNKSELSYEIVSSTPILNLTEDIEDKIELRFKGEPVSNATSLVIRVTNTGQTPITPNDFETAIEIETGASILQYKVTEVKPLSLKPNIEKRPFILPEPRSWAGSYRNKQIKDPGIITVSPLLLNQGDSFTVSLLLNNYGKSLKISARIARINEINEVKNISGYTFSRREKYFISFVFIMGFFSMVTSIIALIRYFLP